MLIPETDDVDKYLEMTGIIDFGHVLVEAAAERLRSEAERFAYDGTEKFAPGDAVRFPSTGADRSASDAHGKSALPVSTGRQAGCLDIAYAKTAFEYVRDALPTPLTC